MIEGKYLSEVINCDDFEDGKLNLITAGCGAGKTTFALEKLIEYFEFEPGGVLYLIDTVAGKEQILKHKNTQRFSYEWMDIIPDSFGWNPAVNEVTCMTYACFGSLVKRLGNHWLDFIDVIICDELHNLFHMYQWDKAKKVPDADSLNCWAIDELSHCIFMMHPLVIGLTATPDIIYCKWKCWIKEIEPLEDIRKYENAQTIVYGSLAMQLRSIQKGQKGIVYIPYITQMEKYIELVRSLGFSAEGIWSLNNADHQMTDEQLKLRQHMLDHSELPEDLDILFVNKSFETSINIFGHINFMIVHDYHKAVQIQARGRYRGDLETLYLYDNELFGFSELPEKC